MRRGRFYWLTAVLALLAAPAVRAEPDEAVVREELRKVYERSEFLPETKDPEDNVILRALRELFSWFGELHITAPPLYWLLLIVCTGLLVFLIVYLATVIRRAAFVGRRGDEETHTAAQRRMLSARLRAEADVQARAGDFTAAVRCLFLALVYAFDESGRLAFQPALTNREYLHGFDKRPQLAAGLGVFVDVLDDNWYGQRPTTEEQYRECMQLYERLQIQE